MLKYIEIDSTYRDRNKFPNPSNFEILVSQSGSKDNVLTSIDPVSYAAPRITYIPSVINTITYVPPLGTPALSIAYAQTLASIICIFPSVLNASKISDYYRGCQIRMQFIVASVSSADTFIITSWNYLSTDNLGKDIFRVNLDKSLPTIPANCTSVTIFCTTQYTNGFVFIPTGETSSQTYKNWYVYNETQNLYSKILTYDGSYALASIAYQTWPLTDTISIRKELPIITGIVQAGSTVSSIVLDPLTSDKRSIAYTGMFLRFTSGTNKDSITGIYSYSGFPGYTAVLLKELPNIPVSGDKYEILPFSKDNYTPFSYSGSAIKEESCYDVQLLHLIVPNINLESGGTIASYPYFYVEFYNQSTTGGTTLNTSYSNNPNATKKLFRVPVSDFSTAIDDAFLTLDKSNSLQTIRINPFGNFKFGIYLPDGTPLTASKSDTTSPYVPNPFLQYSAVFVIRRII